MSLGSIMLVEGPAAGETSLCTSISDAGYKSIVVTSLAEALAQAAQSRPDLVVYDSGTLNKPGDCTTFHNHFSTLPIIQIYPAGDGPNRRNGASFHLTRPISNRMLLNRVNRLLPGGEGEMTILQAGDVTLHVERRIVTVPGVGEYFMTPKQADLLTQFLHRPGELITRKQLMKDVWDTEYVGDTRTLDVHVRWVREKIEENPSKPRRLITKRGQGYIFYAHPLDEEQK